MVSTVIILLMVVWDRINILSHETRVLRDEVIIAQVEKGDLVREIHSSGTLVPIASNFLSATSNGQVKEIRLEASDSVEVGSIIMVLKNPELTQAVDEARLEVEVLQSAYHSLQQRWRQTVLKQRIVVADFSARYEMTKLRRAANQRLLKTGAVSNIDYNESILLEKQLGFQHKLEIELLDSLPKMKQAELVAAQAKINQATRQLLLQEKLADDLYVKATTKGILQEVTLQVGEPFKVGTVLARIAEQDNLKAELRVQESQVKDVIKGQDVVISAGGKLASGIVKRINPSVKDGVVIVDVYFTGDVLVGARPDLRIDGVIALEKLKNVLKLKRPVYSQEYSSSSLFVLNESQTVAQRKQIEFGRTSVDVIEILSPLKEGDFVIVSSTNKYDKLNELALH
ncbi:MAG: HlyD family efflux transporter periplasmic adaptor subunit [Saccharospirillaceae bacterium]|nr:HlyD family efflux transporter periplasmic adaptor subunit [Saccharospirillaceae bacterium]